MRSSSHSKQQAFTVACVSQVLSSGSLSNHGGVTEACRKLSQYKQETGIGDKRPVKDAEEEKAADRAKKKKKNRRCVP
jgi:hypothetical protein